MFRVTMLALSAALVAVPVAGVSGNHKSNNGAKVQGAAAAGCPPGLAKKSPACVPPGQAKKALGRGDILSGDYTRIRNPERYGLKPGETYYRVGDQVVRVDRNTKKVLDLIGAAAAILN